MPIDEREVRHIAQLALLDLDAQALERLRRELGSILDYVALLDQLDVDDVPPTRGAGTERRLRDDTESTSLAVAEALCNAPDSAEDHFRVPRVIKG
ncbi:MAG: Asp-tRNA(Asn)/Glu-tRNA(Gln) amidotransferase subunit GatC [bacterium]|nr:Asp-tRNA(Asn)/Glu-tRNA(Gln) amidotransferase subunit GatC [bacterium]